MVSWFARGLMLGSAFTCLAVRSAVLEVPSADALGWLHLRSAGETGRVHVLQASFDLHTWREAAVFHGGPFDFADVTTGTNLARYFRIASRDLGPADDGRNQFSLAEDPFVVQAFPPLGEIGVNWVKFAILLEDETRVWFQDSNKFPFHHDFARLRLAPFLGMSRNEFDRRTLYRPQQLAVLGALLLPGDGRGEYGIQLVGQEEFTPEEVLRWLRLVQAAVRGPAGSRPLYLPVLEQTAMARSNRDWLAGQGFEVASADRWLSSDAVYSEGWALGRLTYVRAEEIQAAYGDGRLRPTDILLTDAVPAEVPFVAGLITLTPSTPNSHVAILAQGYGVPFVCFSDPARRSGLLALAGREVALRTERSFLSTAMVLDVTGQLPAALRDGLLAIKQPAPIRYVPRQASGVISTNTLLLRPDAVRFVGGKAANYGLLRRMVPSNSEPAIAFTFDLWDAFLDQMLPGGRTLREEIALQLGGLTHPPDIATARVRLAAVRDLFTKTARFTPMQQSTILEALAAAGFDGSRKIRFRSSTNVEDGEDFTGAGLYDSYSGCLLDDLDGEGVGPSACDPAEPNERGVFRAIQKVYASFYNENAFLERLRRGVKEAEVGMAVLVHHSYPDAIELANGVATVRWQKFFGNTSIDGTLVLQIGAESITNPESAARPEVMSFYRSGSFTSVYPQQASARVPWGGHVMLWEADYHQLVGLLNTVANGYAAQFPAKTEFTLDVEFKRIVPGKLDLKQVRPLPQAKPQAVTTVLLPSTGTWCVEEGEFSDVFAKHRLKCELQLTTEARRLDDAGLEVPIYTQSRFAAQIGAEPILLTNLLGSWPEFGHGVSGDETLDRWAVGAGTNRRALTLTSQLIRSATPPQAPWVVGADFSLALAATYAAAQPRFDGSGASSTLSDMVRLVPRPVIGSDSLLQGRAFTNKGKVVVATQFYWPKPPRGPIAGYTAPNIGFLETRITGLTREPLVLTDRFAQTYSPGHHNFSETFLFEPRLDGTVSAVQRAELEAAQVRQLIVDGGFGSFSFWVVSADGKLRQLP
jgi:hypothetical protein